MIHKIMMLLYNKFSYILESIHALFLPFPRLLRRETFDDPARIVVWRAGHTRVPYAIVKTGWLPSPELDFTRRAVSRISDKIGMGTHSGSTRQPPQNSGKGTSASLLLPSMPSRACTSCSLLESSSSSTTLLCSLAQAPILLPTGLLLKYSLLSSFETFSTRPTTLTCLCTSFQYHASAQCGFSCSSRDFREL